MWRTALIDCLWSLVWPVSDAAASRRQLERDEAAAAGAGHMISAVCKEAVFRKNGPLGISWLSRKKDDAAVIRTIKPNGQAASIDGLCAGLILRSINGKPTAGLSYEMQRQRIKLASRPMTLTFEAPSLAGSLRGQSASSPSPRVTRTMSDPGGGDSPPLRSVPAPVIVRDPLPMVRQAVFGDDYFESNSRRIH